MAGVVRRDGLRETVRESSLIHNTRRVQIGSAGHIIITASIDPFTISDEDRDFVFGIVDSVRSYEASQRLERIAVGGNDRWGVGFG